MTGPSPEAEAFGKRMSEKTEKTKYDRLYDLLVAAGYTVALEADEYEWTCFTEVIEQWEKNETS